MAESTGSEDARLGLIEKVRNLAYLCADTEEFTLASGRTVGILHKTRDV